MPINKNFPNYDKTKPKVLPVKISHLKVAGHMYSPGYSAEAGPNRHARRSEVAWDRGSHERARLKKVEENHDKQKRQKIARLSAKSKRK